MSGNLNKDFNPIRAQKFTNASHLSRKCKYKHTVCHAYSTKIFETTLPSHLLQPLTHVLTKGTNRQLYDLVSDCENPDCRVIVDILGLSNLEIFNLLLHGEERVNTYLSLRRRDSIQEDNNILISNRQNPNPLHESYANDPLNLPVCSVGHRHNAEQVQRVQHEYLCEEKVLIKALTRKYGCSVDILMSKVVAGHIHTDQMHPELPNILKKQANNTFLSLENTSTAKGEVDVRHERNINFNCSFHGIECVKDLTYMDSTKFYITVDKLTAQGIREKKAMRIAAQDWKNENQSLQVKQEGSQSETRNWQVQPTVAQQGVSNVAMRPNPLSNYLGEQRKNDALGNALKQRGLSELTQTQAAVSASPIKAITYPPQSLGCISLSMPNLTQNNQQRQMLIAMPTAQQLNEGGTSFHNKNAASADPSFGGVYAVSLLLGLGVWKVVTLCKKNI